MDTTLIKTFLEVVASGNFNSAAEKLFVSQSAVSLRIKSLEDQLGRPVFFRSKSGITLTPAGDQFLKYAYTFLQVWEEAKQQVAVPEGYKDVIVIAGEYGLWNRLLVWWLPEMAKKLSEVAFRAEVAKPDRLTRQMVEGTIDIAVMYTPQLRPGLEVESLFDDKLIMVSTSKKKGLDFPEDYIYIDWGEEFQSHHATNFPDYEHPRITLDLGPISMNYLLNNGGSAYLPERIVLPLIEEGKLFNVKNMPDFSFPAYVSWRTQTKEELIHEAIKTLRTIVKKSTSGKLPPPFWA